MTVTFTVEDGTGVAGANSYVSVSYADDYASLNIHKSSAWTALSTPNKEKLLMWGTTYLDTQARWFGEKTSASNSLRWPRSGVYDADGFSVAENVIPVRLMQAVVEVALSNMSEDISRVDGEDKIEELQVDVIKLKFDVNARKKTLPSTISSLLRGLGGLSSGSVGFGRLIRV